MKKKLELLVREGVGVHEGGDVEIGVSLERRPLDGSCALAPEVAFHFQQPAVRQIEVKIVLALRPAQWDSLVRELVFDDVLNVLAQSQSPVELRSQLFHGGCVLPDRGA